MKREIYAKASSEACDFQYETRLQFAGNLANGLIALRRSAEAKTFLRRIIPTALSTLGPNHMRVLFLRERLGQAQLHDAVSQSSPEEILRELVEAEKLLADVYARQRRLCGASHPDTLFTQGTLEDARAALERALEYQRRHYPDGP